MKKIVILLFSVLLFGFKNPNNDAPIIIHFKQILNEYRHSNGLNPIVIDESIKEFTDDSDDTELLKLISYLQTIKDEPNYRRIEKRGWSNSSK